MKIKASQAQQYNFRFGGALLVLIAIVLLATYQKNSVGIVPTAHRYGTGDSLAVLPVFTAELLELQINQENFKHIRRKREEALESGLLFSSKEDLVPADMRIAADDYPINIRLKGDLLDHLRSEKWSYRVILKQNRKWNGMTTFSIHNSKARAHLAEWYMHQLFDYEGIITPLYDFIQVEENGKPTGVYAYEEHFTDALLQRNNRQVAPIIKHADDAYWDNVQKQVQPFYWTEAMDIELFNDNNASDDDFMESFEYSKSLLSRFLKSEIEAHEVFDVDQMAKYYALMELSHAFHAQQITNIRFYLNPFTGLLEPIAFDCFGEQLPNVTADWESAGQGVNAKLKPKEGYPYGGVYMHLLFQDNQFFESYLYHLDRYTSPTYLSHIQELFSPAVSQRESFIRTDEAYSNYAFSFSELFKKANFTRKKIRPLPHYSLKVFTQHNARKELKIKSFHYFPMEILGFGNDIGIQDTLAEPLLLEAYNTDTPQEIYGLENIKEWTYIYYKTLGVDSVYHDKININNYPIPNANSLHKDLSFWLEHDVLRQDADTLYFTYPKQVLSSHLVIPKGYIVTVQPGQELLFEGEASFISDSPIIAIGDPADHIRFVGNHHAKQGLLSTDRAHFEHCDFINLSGIVHKGIHTTAGLAMTGDSRLVNCTLSQSSGPYAMTLSQCRFDITQLTVSGGIGHGVGIYHSSGGLSHSRFRDIAAHGVTVQQTHMTMQDLDFHHVEGAAIVASDSDELQLDSIWIQDSFEAMVLRDNKKISGSRLNISNVQNGLVLHAPHTKHSMFVAKDVLFENVMNDIKQDQFSTVIIDDEKIVN